MPILHPNRMLSVHAAIIDAHLSESRIALLSGVPVEFVASIPLASTPAEQVLCDLNAMNMACVLSDGSVPLLTWLANAIALAGGRRETATFQEALGQCDEARSTGWHRTLSVAGTNPLEAVHGKVRTLSVVRIALADKKYWHEKPKANSSVSRRMCCITNIFVSKIHLLGPIFVSTLL